MNRDCLSKTKDESPVARFQFNQSEIGQGSQHLDGRSKAFLHHCKDGIGPKSIRIVFRLAVDYYNECFTVVAQSLSRKDVDGIFFIGDEKRVATRGREQIASVFG